MKVSMLDQPPTVLHVISSLGVLGGGAQRQLLLYFRHRTNRWTHTVAYRKSGGILREEMERSGVATHWLGTGTFVHQLIRLIRLARRESASVIHTHLFEANYLGRLAGRILGIPVVTSLVSTMEVEDRAMSGAYRQHWKYRLGLALEALTARGTHTFIAISETVRESAMRALRLPPSRFRVVYRAVQSEPCDRRLPEGPGPTLISVGRLIPSKGHDLLIRMLPEVIRRWPHARLQIVGDGPQLAELRRLACEVGVDDHVHLLGIRNDVPQLLQQADVFVYASWIEGFTLVVAEATAACLPVVTVELPVTRETAPPKSVIFVERDPGAFSGAVMGVLDDLEAFRQVAQEESGPFRERFSVEHFVQGTEAVYGEAVSTDRNSGVTMTMRHAPRAGRVTFHGGR